MSNHVVMLSIPGLRRQDLYQMPRLSRLAASGEVASLTASFPALTWTTQSNMLTGKCPSEHGVIANGFYWRDKHEVEMWTAWNDKILAPQIWDLLHKHDPALTSAVWFPMLSKGCGADYICMPKPVHNPDGSESLWCYTKPTELYGPLRDTFGHFPLQHFWGPLANIKSTQWICDSAGYAAREFKPRFFYLYLPHLDYAAQKLGPDSDAAKQAVVDLDAVLGKLFDDFEAIYGAGNITWLIASEYVITPVDHVTYPNRVLREAGLLEVKDDGQGGELIEFEKSKAWALVDHQMSHVFVKDFDRHVIDKVAELFRDRDGIAEVLVGDQQAKYRVQHERSGEVILVSTPNSWQAYYYWLDDAKAPKFARSVDIHRKPGYDPVELHVDMATRSIPLDATLIKGSHGAPVQSDAQRGILVASRKNVLSSQELEDWDVCGIVLKQFGVE
jgi:predicted AlkP superfamily pyrophosphatase or phosphodiesterase